jgi:hypothetical protein
MARIKLETASANLLDMGYNFHLHVGSRQTNFGRWAEEIGASTAALLARGGEFKQGTSHFLANQAPKPDQP